MNINNRTFAEFLLINKFVGCPSNNVVRLLPPLIIKEQHINDVIEILDYTIP